MGKTYKNKRGDYDDDVENRKQKFRRRRTQKLDKVHDHEKALTPPREEEKEE